MIVYNEEARKAILNGAKRLYDAVKVTYGVKGMNVVIDKYGEPVITHDGVTVAESVNLDGVENIGAKLIKGAARKLNKVAGDGTTTVTVLTYNILNEANKLIAAGVNPMILRREIEAAGDEAVNLIDKLAEKTDSKKIKDIATVSAGDEKIGGMIADVINTVGNDGVVTVEEGRGFEDEKEITEGYSYDKGYASAFFVTDTTRQEAIIDNPHILITDKKIKSSQEILPLLEKLSNSGIKELVIIADEVSGDALQLLVLNKLRGSFTTVVLTPPGFGDTRLEMLKDIAVLTGGEVSDLKDVTLGRAGKVIATKDSTTIINGHGEKEKIESRVEMIKHQLENAKGIEIDVLEKRVASLLGKVAIIKVGGVTETEITEKKFRVEDAVCATKAAISDGFVAGGGVTLVNVASKMQEVDDGHKIMIKALKAPFIHIMENAGVNSQAKLAKVEEVEDGFGYDIMNPDTLVDMKKQGVIDPAKVTKEAVKNSVSIAATIITIGAVIYEEEKDDII